MPAWGKRRSGLPGEHLPPHDVCSNLRERPNGKIVVRQIHETPADEYGLPVADGIINKLEAMIDPSYKWPYCANLHHLLYPRRLYEADPLMQELRDGASMIVCIPTQMHNLLHRTFDIPSTPDRDIVYERVIEQRQIDNLFKLGKFAVRYNRWSNQLRQLESSAGRLAIRDASELSHYYRKKSDIYANRYIEYLERLPTNGGFTDLLPPTKDLVDLPVAVPRLGKIAGQGFVDRRKNAQRHSPSAMVA